MSSPVMHLDLLLKLSPDEVVFDFLACCGLTPPLNDAAFDDAICETLKIAVEIERAPHAVRDAILTGFQHIALLADEAGLGALRAAAADNLDRVPPLHLADSPAQCALWMYLRHRDLFDAACQMRGQVVPSVKPMLLDFVREPLLLPDDLRIRDIRLREINLLDETTGGEITIKTSNGQAEQGVHDLLAMWMPSDNPICRERFQVITAKFDFVFLPDTTERPVRSRSQLLLRRRGGHTLDDVDAGLNALLSAWLSKCQSTNDAVPAAGQSSQAL